MTRDARSLRPWLFATALIAAMFCLLPKLSIPSYTTIIAGTLLMCSWFNTTSDPYGMFHLSLNKLPGEDLKSPPKTEWLNMGFWKETNVFPNACEALCIKLIQTARCQDGDHILDVGHGTGESLILLLSRPATLRPSSVTGITSLPTHYHRSQDRVNRLLAALPIPRPEVHLHLGDAVCQRPQAGHPFDVSSHKLFDRILALDCAYHFHTREDFLRQAYVKLAPSGRIALADICFDVENVQSYWRRLLTSVFRMMPRHNMVSGREYVRQMEEIGYVDVEIEDITEDVFPGFVRFLKGRGAGWNVFGRIVEWYRRAGARFVIVSGSHDQK